MKREKKLDDPVTLFATIEVRQHEALRTIAFNEHRSIADVVRQAIEAFINEHGKLRADAAKVLVSELKVSTTLVG